LRNIFGKKEDVFCAVCSKQLGRHRYRPAKEWDVSGLLCSDCHIDKGREFIEKQNAEQNAPDRCANCQKEITLDEDRNKPKWQWDMDSGLLVCKVCYQKRDVDHNKKINFCSSCNAKLGMFFYHPKPAWKLEGNLCRRCWDERNRGDE
jgi:uncharacterized CHY-type Zn-finger protein